MNADALAYHRCERVIEDIAVYYDQLMLPSASPGADRSLMLQKLAEAFAPNDVVEIAERTFATRPASR